MEHIKVRRMALMAASVCMGVLMSVLLLVANTSGNHTYSQCVVTNAVADTSPKVMLPYPISCTSLVARRLASYDGPFFEDGSGREVLNVAALELKNVGESVIPYAYVVVFTDNGEYTFCASMLPPDATVLIPETEAKLWKPGNISCIFGWTTVQEKEDPLRIDVQDAGEDGIRIENLSQEPVENLTVYFRSYVPEGNVYCGGMAFSVSLSSVAPGEVRTLLPVYYAPGYSRVILWTKS